MLFCIYSLSLIEPHSLCNLIGNNLHQQLTLIHCCQHLICTLHPQLSVKSLNQLCLFGRIQILQLLKQPPYLLES